MKSFRRAMKRSRKAFTGIAALVLLANAAIGQQTETNLFRLSLREAIDAALMNNRALQIQKIEPEIAQARLQSSYGIYDPLFTSSAQKQSDSRTGGLDPLNFDATSAYNADTEQVNAGFTGLLPTGLRYTMTGRYAHSAGVRNFLNFDSYTLGTGIDLSQPLLRDFWIDQPRYTIKVNKQNLQITRLGVSFVAMDIINQTHQAYHDLVFAWEYLRVYQDLLNSRNTFVRSIQRQVELGYRTALEDRVAQANAASIAADLVRASNNIALASNMLKTLMGLTETNWAHGYYQPNHVAVMMPEEFNLAASWGMGLKQRPDLLQLSLNLQNAELLRRYRKNQLFPYLNLIGSYRLAGADSLQAFPPDKPTASLTSAITQIENQNAPSSMIGILFSMPLTRTTEKGLYKESKEVLEQAKLLLKQKEELVMREIADALEMARLNYDRAESARLASSAAELALKAEEQRLEGGTGNVTFVLQAQDFIVSNKIKELESKRDYNKALSQLYFTEGTLLEKVNIQFNYD